MKPLWSVRGCQNNIFTPPKDPGNHSCLLLCCIIAQHQVWTQYIGNLPELWCVQYELHHFSQCHSIPVIPGPWVLLVECDDWRWGVTGALRWARWGLAELDLVDLEAWITSCQLYWELLSALLLKFTAVGWKTHISVRQMCCYELKMRSLLLLFWHISDTCGAMEYFFIFNEKPLKVQGDIYFTTAAAAVKGKH